jgi:hypothetical protein
VHKLTCRITALNRFIAKLTERSLPFFSILHDSANVDWGTEQQKAFDDLKRYLEHFSTLLSPEQGQPLILYVFATHSAVSGALVIKQETMHKDKIAKQQFSVYFVSEVLTVSKKFYFEMEIFCYAVIMSARKLRHYFKHT